MSIDEDDMPMVLVGSGWGVGSLPSAAEAGLTGFVSPTRIFLATTRLSTFARVTWGGIHERVNHSGDS